MNLFVDIELDSGTLHKSLYEVQGQVLELIDEEGMEILTEDDGELIAESTLFYEGDLLNDIPITSNMSNVFYGVAGVTSFSVNLANADQEWDNIIAAEEVRNKSLTVRRGNGQFLARGKISAIDIKPDQVTLSVESNNDELFDTLLPKDLVTADEFTGTSLNIGSPIPICFGYCKNVPLANICNDHVNDYYDYLIGYGPIEGLWEDYTEGRGVRRNGVLLKWEEFSIYENVVTATGATPTAYVTFDDVDATGITIANGMLRIDLMCNDSSILTGDGQIEITSSGYSDSAELHCTTPSGVTDEWKTFEIPLSEFSATGGAINFSAINYMRWYDHSTGGDLTLYWRSARLINTSVPSTEYTFYDGTQASPYNGYAFLRFTKEQRDFTGSMYSLSADVYGLTFSGATCVRNFARITKEILQNTTWGLSETVDESSFLWAESAVPTTSWMCDGFIYEQTAAKDILDNLLFVSRGRLHRNVDGAWEISIDTTGTVSAYFGANDGYYNNCVIESQAYENTSNALKKAVVIYDSGAYKIELDVKADFGVERTYELPFVYELTTAKKVLSYIYGRGYVADNYLTISTDTDGKNVDLGDIIHVSNGLFEGLDASYWKVVEVTKNLSSYQFKAELYSAAIFGDQSIPDPTSTDEDNKTGGYCTIESGTVGGMYITGTTIMTNDGLVGLSSKVSSGTDWRFWAGDVEPSVAPFRVDENGNLYAESAEIEGKITATTGTIGGFTIGATTLTATNLILDSSGQRISLGSGNDIVILDADDASWRLWIGNTTAASANFRVTAGGTVYAYNFTSLAGGDLTVQGGADIVMSGGSATNPSVLRMRDGTEQYGHASIRFEDHTDHDDNYWYLEK